MIVIPACLDGLDTYLCALGCLVNLWTCWRTLDTSMSSFGQVVAMFLVELVLAVQICFVALKGLTIL